MFSIVIPTHDRLDLLREVIETVVTQNYADWELVVFDNASKDGTTDYVKGLAHPKIRHGRSEDFLPVTESWNRAMALATGDYVTLLGDDDGIVPGFFGRMAEIVREFKSPQVIYTALYQYMYPGVLPSSPAGYVVEVKNGFFFVGRTAPFLISREAAAQAVRGSLGLRRNFTYNSQAISYHRDFLKQLKADGPIYRSPFPDYYLANVAFAKARTLVVVPEPLSIAGVSRASFGFTLFNGLEEVGSTLLNTKLSADPLYSEVERFLLPGPLYNTNFVITMQHVARYLPEYTKSGVAFDRYRRLQIYRVLSAQNGRLNGSAAAQAQWCRLSLMEKLWTVGLSLLMKSSQALDKANQVRDTFLVPKLEPYAYQPETALIHEGEFSHLIDFYHWLQAQPQPVSQSKPSSAQ